MQYSTEQYDRTHYFTVRLLLQYLLPMTSSLSLFLVRSSSIDRFVERKSRMDLLPRGEFYFVGVR